MPFRGCAVSWSVDDCSKKRDRLRTVFTLRKAPGLADAADQEQSHGLALAPCYSYWSVLCCDCCVGDTSWAWSSPASSGSTIIWRIWAHCICIRRWSAELSPAPASLEQLCMSNQNRNFKVSILKYNSIAYKGKISLCISCGNLTSMGSALGIHTVWKSHV